MSGRPGPEASFIRIEEEVRRFWRRLETTNARPTESQVRPGLAVVQQPLKAAGQPVARQAQLLATADLFRRYHTMRGRAVQYRMGWACHGLEVELAIERSPQPDLPDVKPAQFVSACRNLAVEGVVQGEALADRLGVWLQPANGFISMERESIGAVWSALHQLWVGGRLGRQRRFVPVCTRCATPLSESEATRLTFEKETGATWLFLPWEGEGKSSVGRAYVLVWSQKPATLPGMVALAAQPDADYALVEVSLHGAGPPTLLLLAEDALERVGIGGHQIVKKLRGKSLRGTRYRPPFAVPPAELPAEGEGTGRLVLSEEVASDEGSGLLAVTPAFDARSQAIAQSHGLPILDVLDEQGKYRARVTTWRGLTPHEVEPLIIKDLQTRGLVFRKDSGTDSIALCPYCETPLLSRARDVWQVETSRGPWIISRNRLWGTPLPVWVCAGCGDQVCVSGLDDLGHKAGLDASKIGLHRPEVDRVTLVCERCGGTMQRVADTVDAAFEAAVLSKQPIARTSTRSSERGSSQLPAGGTPLATIAVGLGRKNQDWLADSTEIGTMLRGVAAWDQIVELAKAREVATPESESTCPADAVRWAAYARCTPEQAERAFLRPLWRFSVDVVEAEREPSPAAAGAGVWPMPTGQVDELLDRWLLARLFQGHDAITSALDAGAPHEAAQHLSALVQDIVGWYAVLSPGCGSPLLRPLSRMTAPFLPHLSEAIHRRSSGKVEESVHRAAWPGSNPAWEAPDLLATMKQVQRLADLGRDARGLAGIPAAQILRQAFVGYSARERDLSAELLPFEDLLIKAMGVREIQIAPNAGGQIRWELSIVPERAVERDLAPEEIQRTLQGLPPEAAVDLAAQLQNRLSAGLEVAGQAITLLPDEVRVSMEAGPGCVLAGEADCFVVLQVE